ncbi:MAG: hypothetical protein R3228_16450, partial [Halioglobus sp.]|nr:hypothetical protein [Halioglobus sp.]
MNSLTPAPIRSLLAVALLSLAACGGGGSGSGADNIIDPQDETTGGGGLLSYADVAPILQARCVGCHSDAGNALAPFSLNGEDKANSYRSAINFTLESQTMPPAGVPQPTEAERAQLLAWSSGQPYTEERELRRVTLVEAAAWDIQPENRDSFLEHRPDKVDCPREKGWLVEDDALEVRTEFCNYLSLSQDALLDLEAGTEMEFTFSHSELNFNAPAKAHLAIAIGGNLLWETQIDIPGDRNLVKQGLTLPFNIKRGDSIELHLRNHGANAWTIHSLEAMVWSDQQLEYCPTFDSTFEAIQATVFEQAGCANSLCHGEAQEGDLDLRPSVAFDNLVGVPAKGSSLLLVDPRKPDYSYLFHKLSAKTIPGSYQIDGSPMPSAGPAISAGQLEAIRLWIEAGSPKEGSVGDTLGRGEDQIENLLGVCLPEAEAVNTTPLPPPVPDRGVQMKMPPHEVLANSEREICFATYEDFRDVIPEQYLTPDGDRFYVASGNTREDAFTHHNLIYLSPVGIDQIHDPAFGEWTCAPDSERVGESCDPLDKNSCGVGGQCRSQIRNSVACRGYGPQSNVSTSGILGLGSGPNREGFYGEYPAHGIFYWNSHAFNLTTEDGIHHVWRNLYFADDRRFRAKGINVTRYITSGTGTPPFDKKTVCRDYVFDQGDGLLSLNSHTHKRGERFFMSVGDELVYETFTYDEPLNKVFDPALVFNSPDPQERVLTWCATWNNGVKADGSPNVETVTRLSRRPDNARPCKPIACVAGNVGASCNGPDDDAACDSAPGAGDGWCDACAIQAGVSSDDEMFILLGSKVADHDAKLNAPGPDDPQVRFLSPGEGDVFSAGDTVDLSFEFTNFELAPPEGHDHDDGDDHEHGGDHMDPGGDHSAVTMGHYH